MTYRELTMIDVKELLRRWADRSARSYRNARRRVGAAVQGATHAPARRARTPTPRSRRRSPPAAAFSLLVLESEEGTANGSGQLRLLPPGLPPLPHLLPDFHP